MKQYLLTVQINYAAPAPPDDEVQKMYGAVGAVNDELRKAGHWVFAGGLLPPESATVVRADANGDTTTTDGPYAETKETIGGFWVLKCADLDEALAWAKKCTVACGAPVEVRPFEDDPTA